MKEFEPRIVGFLCKWCSYTCADLTGVSRIQYPPNLRVIRVMCSGRVDPAIILGILAEGADGVMIIGCKIGGVNCATGNPQVKRKFSLTRRLVEKAGLEPGRLMLEWMSASDELRFARLVAEFTEQVRELGPSPLSGDSPDPNLLLNVRAARAAAEDFRLRELVAKEEKLVTEGNVYGDLVTQEELDDVIAEAVESEYVRHRIRLALLEEPTSVKKLSERLGMDSRKVLDHVVAMRLRGWLEVQEIRGISPIYRVLEVPQ